MPRPRPWDGPSAVLHGVRASHEPARADLIADRRLFPDAVLEAEDDSAPVAWQAGGRAGFRLGQLGAGPGVVLQCFRSSYRLIPEGPESLADEDRRLLATILRVMDLRCGVLFDFTMANRLEIADHMSEDPAYEFDLCRHSSARGD